MKGIYNPKKLTTDRERFHKIRVLNIGAGAVGSAAVEHEAKLCLSLDVIDDDRFEPDNAAKRSCLVRTPEDDGSNKALCLGRRVQPLLDDGCTANGIDANLRLLGPEALADYDVIVCAVDNNAAKVLLNELVRRLRAIEGIRELAMTTNGARLAEYAGRLKSAGLDRLNVSLDTLDPEKYRKITRIGSLSDTLAGLDAARSAGFTRIKLNAVLMGGVNDDEIPALAELARDGAFDVRFIELMPIGECADWDRKRFIPAERVLEVLPQAQRVPSDGVAELWRPEGWKGTVGLIRPLSHRFCADCDRIRITPDGMLKPCLHSAREIPLRGKHGEALVCAIAEGIGGKPKEHHITDGRTSDSLRGMNRIGG